MKQILITFILLLSGITNAQTFDFSCGSTTEELISERIALLQAIVDNNTYIYAKADGDYYYNDTPEGVGYEWDDNGDGYALKIYNDQNTYFNYGILNIKLGDPDGSTGWDNHYALALQAVIDAETEGAVSAAQIAAEELASLTSSRTLELKAKGSATTSVTIRWDGGHIITVDGNDILARDHGHNNYGKSTQDQFDALLKVVEDAVIAADFVEAAPGEAVGKEARYLELESLSRDGVNITAADAWDGWRIKFKDDDDNLLYFGEQDQDFIFNNPIADISPSEYLYEYNKYVQRVIDLVNSLNPYYGAAFTFNQLDTAASDASTDDVTITRYEGVFEEGHTSAGQAFVGVKFTDPNGYITTFYDSKFDNGGTSNIASATLADFNKWVDDWKIIQIPFYQTYVLENYAGTREQRLDYVDTLITGNTTLVHDEDVAYLGVEGDEGDVFTISYEGATDFQIILRPLFEGGNQYGKIQDLEGQDLIRFYNQIKTNVAFAQGQHDL